MKLFFAPAMVVLMSLIVAPAARAAEFPAPAEGDFVSRDFRFGSGETLAALNLHYRTIGTPQRDASGVVRNAVMILHGTGGSGAAFLSQTFGGELFGAGQVLDATRYFIILPDGVGHGKSSKPSDALHARFPKYTYDDMVRAQHEMLVAEPKTDEWRSFPLPSRTAEVTSVALDPFDGERFYVGTQGEGIFIFEGKSAKYEAKKPTEAAAAMGTN